MQQFFTTRTTDRNSHGNHGTEHISDDNASRYIGSVQEKDLDADCVATDIGAYIIGLPTAEWWIRTLQMSATPDRR
jgi:hypothetical protein